MRLYIIRHGKAHKHSESGLDDDRSLKGHGEAQAAFLGKALAASTAKPDVILASPILRAAQTAEIINQQLALEIHTREPLSTRSGEREALAEIATWASHGCVAVVGHNPTLETLVAILCRPTQQQFNGLRTGECIAIDFDGPMGAKLGRFVASIRLSGDDD